MLAVSLGAILSAGLLSGPEMIVHTELGGTVGWGGGTS
jgi:hypothetical protein